MIRSQFVGLSPGNVRHTKLAKSSVTHMNNISNTIYKWGQKRKINIKDINLKIRFTNSRHLLKYKSQSDSVGVPLVGISWAGDRAESPLGPPAAVWPGGQHAILRPPQEWRCFGPAGCCYWLAGWHCSHCLPGLPASKSASLWKVWHNVALIEIIITASRFKKEI